MHSSSFLLIIIPFVLLSLCFSNLAKSIYPFEPNYSFFSITGLVSRNSARIMYFSPKDINAQVFLLENLEQNSASIGTVGTTTSKDGISVEDRIFNSRFTKSIDSIQKLASLYNFNFNQLSFIQEISLNSTSVVPSAFTISNLNPSSVYIVQFEEYAVRFRTLGLESIQNKKQNQIQTKDQPFKAISLSCDRYVEDKDDKSWRKMFQRNETFDIMFHMGDQIYTDWIYKKRNVYMMDYLNNHFLKLKENLLAHQNDPEGRIWIDSILKSENLQTLEEFTEIKVISDPLILMYFDILGESVIDYFMNEFRKVYHIMYERWIVKDIYSRGAHIMMPDDHDILNNVNYKMVQKTENDLILKSFVIAGRQSYYQYQYKLVGELPESFELTNLNNGIDIWNFDLKTDGLCFYVLDTRYETSFRHDFEFPVLGKRQHEAFFKSLKECPQENSIIVLTSVPLVQLDEFMASIVHFVENEYYPPHPEFAVETELILEKLLPYQNRLLLVSGDIHQFLKTRLIRKSNQRLKLNNEIRNDTTSNNSQSSSSLDIIHLSSSSGMSVGSRVMSELHIYLFNVIVRYFSFPWFKSWTIDHFEQSLSMNYMVIQKGLKTHIYDPEGISYYGVTLPYESSLETTFALIHHYFIIVEIIFIVTLGVLIMCILSSCKRKISFEGKKFD